MNSFPSQRFLRFHNYVLTFLVCTLSVTVKLKAGQIQYLELVLAADLLLVFAMFMGRDVQVSVFRPFLSIGKSWAIFMVLAFLLAVIGLRQDFFPFNNNPLKQPLVITLSRIAELFLDAFYMVYLASFYREDERLCRFGARVYYWMGIIGGLYAVSTIPLGYAAKGHFLRLTGFNNEGGSYGTYLISVCLLTMVMYRKGWIGRRRMQWSMALFLFCMVGSESKAAFFAVAVLTIVYLMWTLKGWRLWTMITVMCLGFTTLAYLVNLPAAIEIYEQGSELYQKMSNLKAEDANYVMGRVSGAVMAPRMIAAHPLAGIGWGNYPLVRDDPQYRRGTAFILGDLDSPSLGPIDYIVELGIPLWIYLTWIEIKPVYLLRRKGANQWILCLASMLPLANWFGAHLNITYPWVAVGLALGVGFTKKEWSTAEPIS